MEQRRGEKISAMWGMGNWEGSLRFHPILLSSLSWFWKFSLVFIANLLYKVKSLKSKIFFFQNGSHWISESNAVRKQVKFTHLQFCKHALNWETEPINLYRAFFVGMPSLGANQEIYLFSFSNPPWSILIDRLNTVHIFFATFSLHSYYSHHSY